MFKEIAIDKLLALLLVICTVQIGDGRLSDIDQSAQWAQRLYNFTYEAREILAGKDDDSTQAPILPFGLPYCKTDVASTVFVCTNGLISFNKALCPFEPGSFGAELKSTWPIVAPFYADLTLTAVTGASSTYNTITNALYIRGNTSINVVDRATRDVQKFLGTGTSFKAIWVYVATWYNTRAWGSTEGVTFQVALITDGIQSFVRFSYGEMLWASSFKPAQVGYKFPTVGNECQESLNFTLSGYGSFKYPLDKITGNIGEPGVWLYELTHNKKVENDVQLITINLMQIGSNIVKIGERVFLFCQSSHHTEASYTWYRNNVVLPDYTDSLLVLNTTLTDKGRYHCEMSHGAAKKRSPNEIEIFVKYIQKPVVKFIPQASFLLNTPVAIYCQAQAFPSPEYEWYKGGELIKNVIEPVLMLSAASWNDTDVYSCKISNIMGMKTSDEVLLPLWEISNPIVTPSMEGLVPEGSNVTISCSPADNTDFVLTWMTLAGELVSSNETLSFENITREQSGGYVCKSSKEKESKLSRRVFLNVTYFERMTLYITPSNVIHEDNNITLLCSIVAVPSVSTYNWYLNNVFLESTETQTLHRFNVSKQSAGNYTCKVSHDLGNKSASVILDVVYIQRPNISGPSSPFLEHSNGQLVCLVDAFPRPTAWAWYKDGALLNSTCSNLVLVDMSRNDAGKYTCEVSNAFGTERSEVHNVTVSYLDRPMINASNLNPEEGENVTLSCTANASPDFEAKNGDFVWTHNTDYVSSGPVLVLENIKHSASGTYQCTTTNMASAQSSSFMLSVSYLSKPFIKVCPDVNVVEFQTISFTCHADGFPILTYDWANDGVTFQKNVSEISLFNVTRKKAGSYECIVSNGAGKSETKNVSVNIQYIDTPDISVSNQNPEEGDTMQLSCDVVSNPQVLPNDITWKHNGVAIGLSNPLILSNVSKSSSGVYECIVKNVAGYKSNTTTLFIHSVPRPTVSRSSPSSLIKENSTLLLTCNVEETLPLTYTWLKDGHTVSGATSKLNFETVTRADRGKYACSVVYGNGNVTTSVEEFIDVFYIDKPKMISQSKVKAGSATNFSCTLHANPSIEVSDWQWKHNGVTVGFGPVLQLNNTTKKESGIYECSAKNIAGATSAVNNFVVQYLDAPVISASPSSSVHEEKQVTLTCDTQGTLPITYRWLKDGSYISGSNQSLVISNARRNIDNGTYQCDVSNVAFTAQSPNILVEVIYIDAPSITSIPEQPIIGGNVFMQCFVDMFPAATSMEWMKDGKKLSQGATLSLNDVQMKDSGTYQCIVMNKAGLKFNSTQLELSYLDTPMVTVLSTDINEGSSLILYCNGSGSYPLTYGWMKDGSLLVGKNNAFLLLNNVSRSSSGDYRCIIVNPYGNKHSDYTTVLVSYIDPVSIIPSQNLTNIRINDDITLICSTNGTPSVSYIWRFKQNIVSTSTTLILNKLANNEVGEYQCEASNGITKATKSIVLEIHYMNKPVIQAFPGNIVHNGNPLLLTCKHFSSDDVSYEWFKEETKLTWTSQQVPINNVTVGDIGNYSCSTANSFFQNKSSSIKIIVYYLTDPNLDKVQLLLFEGDSKNITCASSGAPKVDYSWKFNGNMLSMSNVLVLENVSKSEAGGYECITTNGFERKTVKLNLRIDYLTSPVISKSPLSITNEEDAVVFTCHARGESQISYQWFKDDALVAGTEFLKIINNIKRTDHGLYHCVVKNNAGTKNSSEISLDVRYIDQPIIATTNKSNTIVLNCSTNGNPEVTYKWVLDDITVSTNKTVEFVGANKTYLSRYTCTVKNTVGELSTKLSVDTNYLNKPTLSKISHGDVWEGDSVVLKCSVEGTLPITYQWYKEDVALSGSQSTYVLNSISKSEEGSYRCVAANVFGTKSSHSTIISVLYIGTPVITTSPSTNNTTEGDNLALTCKTSGQPVPTYQWYQNNLLLSNLSVLTLPNVKISQSGEYVCKASGGGIVLKEAAIDIKIQYLYQPDVKVLPSAVAREECSVILICNTTSSEPVNYIWFKDGTTVSSTNVLTIKNTTRNDAGNFSCSVTNGLGNKISSVISLSVMYMDTPSISISYANKSTTGLIMEGDNVVLTCAATANPSPSYKWLKNNTVISTSDTLSLPFVQITHSGIYTCIASNTEESRSLKTTLVVNYFHKPYLTALPVTATTKGSTLILFCKHSSNQIPSFSWFKNGKQLIGNNNRTIVLANLTKADEGDYSCNVTNILGWQISNVYPVQVQYIDEISILPRDPVVIEGANFVMTCSCSGYPIPSYQWFYKDVLIGTQADLSINQTTVQNSGKYDCLATSGSLSLRLSTVVTVKYLRQPFLSVIPSDMVKSQQCVSMTCMSNASDSVSYQWYKNDVLIPTETLSNLLFEKVRHSDSGNFTCATFSSYGDKKSLPVPLNVAYLNSPIIVLSHSSVKIGDSVELKCIANGTDPVTFEWFHAGGIIYTGSTYNISSVNISHAGEYKCIVGNGYFNKTASTVLNFDYLTKPFINAMPFNYTPQKDGAIILNCLANSSSIPSYSWFRNNSLLSSVANSLILTELKRSDAGLYKCVVTTKFESKESNIYLLEVSYLDKPVINPNAITVTKGETVSAECISTGHPYVTYTWKHKGKLISNSSILTISNVQYADKGTYECLVSNSISSEMSAMAITVEYLNQPSLSIDQTSQPRRGQAVILSCSAEGSGDLVYKWYLNGFLISGNTYVKYISNVQLDDQGLYKCVVTNNAGEKSATALLNVTYIEPPVITKSNISRSSQNLTCHASGYPEPTYVWKENDVIASNESFVVVNGLNTSQIASFKCIARNIAGELSTSTSSSSYYLKLPVLKVLPPAAQREGLLAMLICKADGTSPLSYGWYKDGNPLSETTSNLIIKSLKRNDSGAYTCTAMNPVGVKHSMDVNLEVQYMDQPVISIQPKLTNIVQGENVNISCTTTAQPTATYQWIHKNTVLSTSQNLLVTNIQVTNAGLYTCVANNGVESLNSSVDVVVNYMNRPYVEVISSTKSIEGNSVVLNCHSNSSLSVTYEWKINGVIDGTTTKQFVLMHALRSDAGSYQCVTTSRLSGAESLQFSLDITYIDTPIVTLPSNPITKGTNITLTCSTLSNPSATYSWIKDGIVAATGPSLQITNASPLNRGEYICEVNNSAGKKSSSVNIDVQYLDEPVITSYHTNRVSAGSAMALTCAGNGTSPIAYSWYKNGIQVSSTSQLKIINDIKKQDGGEYTCQVSNLVGEKTSKPINVTVIYLETPVISKTTNGNLMNLTCTTRGDPPPTYVWYENEARISNKSHLVIENNSSRSKVYKCQVENTVGVRTATLSVAEDVLNVPVLTVVPTLNPSEGGCIMLSCTVDGTTPITYQWYKKDVLVNDAKESVLIFETLQRDAAGDYKCSASNSAGTKFSAKKSITVNYLDSPTVNTSALTVSKGEDIVVSCSAIGTPTFIDYAWTKDGNTVVNNSLLVVRNAKIKDGGKYTCHARSSVGEKTVKVVVTVRYLAIPILTSSSNNRTKEGDTFLLMCKGDGTAPLSYAWRKDNFSIASVTGYLTIENARRDDAGVYTCVVTNSVGDKISNQLKVDILYMNDPVISPLTSTYSKNDVLNVTCVATANNVISYEWKKGGKLISTNQRLIIPSLDVSNDGTYECHVDNGVLKKTTSLSVLVQYLSQPRLSISPENMTKVGDAVVFQCDVSGSSLITYTWYKNSVQLSWTQSKHIINNIQKDDTALYLCKTSNMAGTKSSNEVQLSVQYLNKPSIHKKNTSDTSLELSCSFTGSPMPSVAWYKDGVKISDSANLTVNDVRENDTSVYKCVVTNLVGSLTATTSTSKDFLLSPTIVIKKSASINEGDSVVFICQVDGTRPITYTWFKHGRIVGNTSDMMILNNVSKADQAGYVCQVGNAAGVKSSKTVQLTVLYLDTPKITKNETFTGDLHSVLLDCTGNGAPTPQIHWMKDGARFSIQSTVLILNKNQSYSGEYSCMASNPVGLKSASVDVKLYYLNEPAIASTPSKNHKEGDYVILECSVLGTNPLSYKWFKDSQVMTGEVERTTTLKNVSVWTNGNYSCEVGNILTTKYSMPFEISVAYLDKPAITTSLQEIYDGDDVTLQCIASGTAPITYLWKQAEAVLFRGQMMVVKNISFVQNTIYSCEASSVAGVRTTDVNLKPKYLTTPVLSVAGAISVLVSSSISIRCTVMSSHTSEVKYDWFKNNVKLQVTSNVLILSAVTSSDSAEYSCVGQLGTIRRTSTSNLTLHVQDGSTEAPVCGANKKLVLFHGILKCECADGFYGNDCVQQTKSIQASIAFNKLCNRTECYAGKALWKLMDTNQFYLFAKKHFETQLLDGLQNELSHQAVKSVVVMKKSTVDMLSFDFMMYFDASTNLTTSQVQDMLSIVSLKTFVNTDKSNGNVRFGLASKPPTIRDFNHCTLNTTNCDVNAECLPGDMTYHCRCKSGYVGDGRNCKLINIAENEQQKKERQDLMSTTIVLGTILAFIFSAIICCWCYVFCKRKYKDSLDSTCTDSTERTRYSNNNAPSSNRDKRTKQDLVLVEHDNNSESSTVDFYESRTPRYTTPVLPKRTLDLSSRDTTHDTPHERPRPRGLTVNGETLSTMDKTADDKDNKLKFLKDVDQLLTFDEEDSKLESTALPPDAADHSRKTSVRSTDTYSDVVGEPESVERHNGKKRSATTSPKLNLLRRSLEQFNISCNSLSSPLPSRRSRKVTPEHNADFRTIAASPRDISLNLHDESHKKEEEDDLKDLQLEDLNCRTNFLDPISTNNSTNNTDCLHGTETGEISLETGFCEEAPKKLINCWM
ncbi:hemicentin-1-like isoform X2 [Hydractinia symbiolongicarpus]|uniref:hemicentin-1-like isoform X2 n=1 Tax=Hydractinia symbiolongicarpus TaxID=13093 RepID=UPI00254C72BF|nr:hemicentin-1-like isoform X2 [Hydractinia symbiolongicarpus]